MSALLQQPTYRMRDENALLAELVTLSDHHIAGCPEYARIWRDWQGASSLQELPWIHVGLFKHLLLRTASEAAKHERVLKSSATSSGVPSQIALDQYSSQLQSTSTSKILGDFLGDQRRPLMVLDSARSLRARGQVSARIAAAMSLRPLASEIHFLLSDAEAADSVQWEVVGDLLSAHDELLIYGFTWMLWLAWGAATIPADIRSLMRGKTLHFVHSGGWKKLEALSVDHQRFNEQLLQGVGPQSSVLDFYGLVEQAGVIFPECTEGYRHVPAWAGVLVRDPVTLAPQIDQTGQLQLLNTLAHGAPYHSVLTEDLGYIVDGECACGREGPRFKLMGRLPRAELRGCANA